MQFLIDVLADCNDINYTLSIIGEGDLKKNIKEKIIALNLSDKIKLRGFIPHGMELLNEYSKHNVFIMPSFSEGLPQVVLEAMAKGVLVVSTAVGGLEYLINNEVNGLIFQVGNKENLKDTLTKVSLNKYNDVSIRKRGIDVAKYYSIEKQIKIFYNTINENKRPGKLF